MRQIGVVHAAFRRSRAAVAATFAAHAVVAGTIGPWMPRLKANSGLDASGLGVALTGYAVGLVLGTRVAGPALRRAGGRSVVRAGVPVLCGALALLPLANGLGALAGSFAGIGLASGVLDVAMNTEAVAVEQRFTRRVMSAMHGAWSVAVLAGAALASASVAAGIPIGVHLPAVAALLFVASFPLLRWLPSPHEPRGEFDAHPSVEGERGRSRRVVLLCLVGFASFLTEGVAIEWSAVYLHEAVGATVGTAGLGVVAFSVGMTVSRFVGDRLSARLDPSTVVRVGTSVGAVVLAAALAGGGVLVSLAALAVLGLCIGPVVPLAFRAAGGVGLPRGRTALGIVVTAGYVGSILGPLAVGFTADLAGLRAAFTIPVITCAVVAVGAGGIRERHTRA